MVEVVLNIVCLLMMMMCSIRFTKPDYFYNVGADDDRDYDEDGYDDDLNALIMLLLPSVSTSYAIRIDFLLHISFSDHWLSLQF